MELKKEKRNTHTKTTYMPKPIRQKHWFSQRKPKSRVKRVPHFNDFVQALVSHHPDVGLAVVAAKQKHLHGDAKQLLKLWRRSVQRVQIGPTVRKALIQLPPSPPLL